MGWVFMEGINAGADETVEIKAFEGGLEVFQIGFDHVNGGGVGKSNDQVPVDHHHGRSRAINGRLKRRPVYFG